MQQPTNVGSSAAGSEDSDDPANEVMFVVSGSVRAVEAGVVLGPGEAFGELGLLARNRKRTQTVVCEADAVLLVISCDEVRQLYFQNPTFGFFFLELVAERLMRDAQRAAPPGPKMTGS